MGPEVAISTACLRVLTCVQLTHHTGSCGLLNQEPTLLVSPCLDLRTSDKNLHAYVQDEIDHGSD